MHILYSVYKFVKSGHIANRADRDGHLELGVVLVHSCVLTF